MKYSINSILIVGSSMLIGLPSHAATITNVQIDSFTATPEISFVKPGERASVILSGRGSYTWENGEINEKVTTEQSITIAGDTQNFSASNNQFLTGQTGTLSDALFFTALLGVGKYTATYTFSVNPEDTESVSFEIKSTPEPTSTSVLLIFGVLGTASILKRKQS